MFSEEVKKALIEAGWKPGREIDIAPYEQALINEGYYLPSTLKKFLSEFGGLYIKYPTFYNFTYEELQKLKKYSIPGVKPLPAYQIMNFNVIEIFTPPSPNPMTKEEIFEPRIGEDMIEFGEIWDGRYGLAMTPSGKIYARDVDSILFLGNNYIEMLENELHHVRPIEVP